MSLVPPFVFAVAPGIILVATGLVAVWVCAARRRQSTLPARLIVGGMGLAILGAAILALLNAVAQRSLLPLIAVLALGAPGYVLTRVALKAREYESDATGTRTVAPDLGYAFRDLGRSQVIVSAGLIVVILLIAVTSGELVLALLAIAPAVTLLTGAALSSVQRFDTTDRALPQKPGEP